MELDRQELEDLAYFFAKRFPDDSKRARLARLARLPDPEARDPSKLRAWHDVLLAAHEMGTLHRLAQGARKMHPEDENLQSVCALLLRKGRISGQALTAAASVMLVAGAATAAMVGDTSLVSPAPTQATMAIPSAQLSPEPDPIDEPLATLAELSTPKKLEPTAERVVSDAQPEAQPQPTTTRTTRSNSGYDPEVYPAMVDGRCTTEPGALVGYWYAGEQLPGSVGETIMVDRSVHVRRDFPRYGNQFDTRTPTQCFLVEGDEITLREAPIPVPPDSWWVPLHSGDLLRD